MSSKTDRANGLTGDWSEVEQVCQRLDAERSARTKWKERDGTPSQQEEGARKGESTRLSFGAWVEEAYAALKPRTDSRDMVLIGILEETNMAYEEMEDGSEESWHDGSKEGCDMACETVDEGTRERPDRGPSRATLRALLDAIRSWFDELTPESA